MEELKKVNQSLDNLTTSSEVTETLLGQIFDQNIKLESLITKKDAEEFKLSDFKVHLKKLKESVNRNDLLRSNMDLLIKKVDAIKPPVEVVTNNHIMELLGPMSIAIKQGNKKDEPKQRILFFEGDNPVINYKRGILGIYLLLFFFLGINYLPNYFLEKQRLDDNYQVLQLFAESHKLKEFFEEDNTDEYDKEINSIRKKDDAYIKNYNKIKKNWNKEHQKVELVKKIKEKQEQLKQLQK